VPNNEILTSSGDKIYDAPHNGRTLVDLSTLPLIDGDGHEIEIFDKNRMKIARREGAIAGCCGALLNLSTAGALFDNSADNDFYSDCDDDEQEVETLLNPPPKLSVREFPLAFTRCGHIQANCGLISMKPVLARINSAVACNYDDASGNFHSEAQPIKAEFTQVYNEFTHRFAPDARSFEVTSGMATAALSGQFIRTSKHKVAFEKAFNFCDTALPHQRFKDRMDNTVTPKDLRLEQNYTIIMDGIKDEFCTGE
jgi:hypothetical protein